MIDEYSEDGTGWARFSDDRRMRYRLARGLWRRERAWPLRSELHRRVVFVMLNPSTADAFHLDPTVTRCRNFAIAWGADVLEVVNIFALRSTDPEELYKHAHGMRGDDTTNNEQILEACRGAQRVVIAWGVHGAHDLRGQIVHDLLWDAGITLHHLGLTKAGHPRHPLYLKSTTELQEWR